MTARASKKKMLLLFRRSGDAHEPFHVGELCSEISGPVERNIRFALPFSDGHQDIGIRGVVFDSSYGEPISTWHKSVRRKTVEPPSVADDRNRDRAPCRLGTD